MTTETTFGTFCATKGVTITAAFTGREERNGWKCFAWNVTLGYQGRTLTQPYFCGLGHVTKAPKWDPNREGRPIPPNAADVLASLLSDASCAAGTFADFCSDLGYDTDSRKALATYLACQEEGPKVRKLIGKDFAAFQEAAQGY